MLPVLLLLSACGSPELQVLSVTELGTIEQASTISGRDGGYSARVCDRSVWLYGDSVLSVPNEDGETWCNNTMSWTEDFDASDNLSGFTDWADARAVPVEFLPQTEVEAEFNTLHDSDDCQEEPCGARWALWPGAIVEDPARERALVFYSKIYAEPGAWNFESVGSGIATWGDTDQEPERPEVDAGHEHPTLLWHDPELAFGAAALVEGDFLYAFACEGDWQKPCKLGRVELPEATEPESWSYWDGERWSSDPANAEPVFDAHTMLSVHWNPLLERYLAAYNTPMDDRVYLRTAERLEGPWSGDEAVFMAQSSHDGSTAYGGMLHPELDREDGRFVYLSYFRAPADWEGEIQLVEIELSP